MSPAAIYFAAKRRLWGHTVAEHLRQPVQIVLQLLVMLAIWGALYQMFRSGFSYAMLLPWLDTYVISGMFGMFFLLVVILLVLTSIVLTQYGLYQSPEAQLLMVLPIAPARAAMYRSIELGVFNSLGALYMVTPLLWAYVQSQELPPSRLLYALVLVVPLFIIPYCLGASFTVALRRMAGRVPTRLLVFGGILIFLGAFSALLTTFDFGIFEQADHPVRLVNQTADALSGTRHWFLPSYWYVEALFSVQRGYPKMMWWFTGVLTTVAAACLCVWAVAIRELYYPSWLAGSDTPGGEGEQARPRVNRLAQWARALWPVPAVIRTLLAKDALLFIREPVVRTQGLVMVGILLVYFASLRSVYSDFAELPLQKLGVGAMNFAALGVLLSAFACRFLLPLISIEGRKFWLLRTAPPRLEQIMAEKWVFGSVVLLVLGQPMLAMSNYMTTMDRVFVLATHTALLCLVPTVVAVAIGMGALFPDLKGGDAHAGTAATLAFVVCLLCVAGFFAVLALPYTQYVATDRLSYPGFIRALWHNVAGAGLIGVGVGLFMLFVGHLRLSRAEIP